MLCRSKRCGLLTIIFTIIISKVCAGKMKIECPEFCECDIFQTLRRAVCQHKRLVSIELNIPPQAQILDISYNQISELGDKIFLEIGLTDLKLLNLSHNKVREIHFNGFEGLEKVKTLDLSFNAVQYFTKSWFVSLSSLQELYLRGNKLRSINAEPLIAISTLRVLDLGKCGITHLDPTIFTMVPNLEVLDISENYLQLLKVEVVKPLSKLILLKALDNNFNCKDRGLINVKTYTREAGISYNDPCTVAMPTSFTINSMIQKLEKIVMASDVEVTTSTQPKNLWILDDQEINNTKIIEVCSNGTQQGNREDLNKKSLLMNIIELSPLMVLSITFVYGVLSGMVISCVINLCIQGKKRNMGNIYIPDGSISLNTANVQSFSNLVSRRDKRHIGGSNRSNSVLYTTFQKAKRQLSSDNVLDDDFDDSLVMTEFDLGNSTPMPDRKAYV